ncbi:MAG: transglycosylase domain-containing protein, partial [Bdellovibrionales bacterium]|nr:transglycosylase domain-containing protein [Bdellovibrionales bacterium]
MEFLFATLMVLSHFDPYLPKPTDYLTKSKPNLVQMYSNACLKIFSRPEFKDLEIQDLLQNVLSGDEFQQNAHLNEKINAKQSIELYKKICKLNPDLHALDVYTQDIAQAEQRYNALVQSVQSIKITPRDFMPESTEILDRNGQLLTESFQSSGRRKWVSLKTLPKYVPMAFVSVEDRRFFEHKGADEIGILRAIMKSFVSTGRPEGGSTITQQVARNLYLNSNLTLDRKLKEILIAEKLEAGLTKWQILEIYLNLIYFGRDSWGIYKAAESYFGKTPDQLTIAETAYLVGIVQGPNLYQTDYARIESRVNFVYSKFFESKIIPAERKIDLETDLKFTPINATLNANYFRDYLISQTSNNAKEVSPRIKNSPIRSTIHPVLQKVSESALQNGLISYEKKFGRHIWKGPVTNIASQIDTNVAKLETRRKNAEIEKQKSKESLFGFVVSPADADLNVNTNTSMNQRPEQNDSVQSILQTEDNLTWSEPLQQVKRVQPPPVVSWQLSVALDSYGNIGFIDGTKA